jgi:hypothetical protein
MSVWRVARLVVLPAKRQEHHQPQDTVIAWVEFAGFPPTAELLTRDTQESLCTLLEHRPGFLWGELMWTRLRRLNGSAHCASFGLSRVLR